MHSKHKISLHDESKVNTWYILPSSLMLLLLLLLLLLFLDCCSICTIFPNALLYRPDAHSVANQLYFKALNNCYLTKRQISRKFTEIKQHKHEKYSKLTLSVRCISLVIIALLHSTSQIFHNTAYMLRKYSRQVISAP